MHIWVLFLKKKCFFKSLNNHHIDRVRSRNLRKICSCGDNQKELVVFIYEVTSHFFSMITSTNWLPEGSPKPNVVSIGNLKKIEPNISISIYTPDQNASRCLCSQNENESTTSKQSATCSDDLFKIYTHTHTYKYFNFCTHHSSL